MDELDPLIHVAARLRITATLATLAVGDRIAFARLQELLDMTAGNLSTHLRKLEDAGYVEVDKTHQGRTPVTWLALYRAEAHSKTIWIPSGACWEKQYEHTRNA